MDQSPNIVRENQLKELGLNIDIEKED